MSRYRWWWLLLWVWPISAFTDAFCAMFIGVHIFSPGINNVDYIVRTAIGLFLLFVLLLVASEGQHLKAQQ